MNYAGGKNGVGVYQSIINLIPPHKVYIEPFLGSGAIMRHKLPACHNIGLDLDAEIVKRVRSTIAKNSDTADTQVPGTSSPPTWQIEAKDAFHFLENYPFTGDEFIYCDPPYMRSTRRSKGDIYKHELTRADHRRLLKILKTLPCKVLLSSYWSELHSKQLKNWNTETFQIMTRGYLATEWLWFNYNLPDELHDYRYLGDGFRERERIKRKKQRWVARLQKMPDLERQAMLEAIKEAWG